MTCSFIVVSLRIWQQNGRQSASHAWPLNPNSFVLKFSLIILGCIKLQNTCMHLAIRSMSWWSSFSLSAACNTCHYTSSILVSALANDISSIMLMPAFINSFRRWWEFHEYTFRRKKSRHTYWPKMPHYPSKINLNVEWKEKQQKMRFFSTLVNF